MYVGTMHDIRRCMCRRAGGHDIPGPLSYMHICAAWPLPSATPHGEWTSADQSGQADLARVRARARARVRLRIRNFRLGLGMGLGLRVGLCRTTTRYP